MKKALFSAGLILFMVIAINLILYRFVYDEHLPYYWGSEEISDKRSFLTAPGNNYNAVFIGSSKTHNQVVNNLFDSLAGSQQLDIRSYNFGVGGLTPPESLHIYENLLEEDSVNLKYAFIELDWVATIKYENLNVARSFYWLTPQNYSQSIKSVFGSSMPLPRKAWGMFHYSLDFAENMLNVGKVEEVFRFKKATLNKKMDPCDSNIVHNGFIPMHEKMHHTEESLYQEVVAAANHGEAILAASSPAPVANAYLDRLQEIVSMSRDRGTEVVFVVPLQWKSYQYDELIPIMRSITGAKVIPMFEVGKFGDVYQKEHFADPNHLSYPGARLYTEELFKSFYKLLRK